jgi:hypothetical protein
MSDAVEVLRAVRELLAESEAWCQGAWARDGRGRPVGSTRANAVAWCLVGALAKVRDPSSRGRKRLVEMLDEMLDEMFPVSLPAWNDAPGRTHAEVLALLDAAISSEERV